jgi:hypothetical protein
MLLCTAQPFLRKAVEGGKKEEEETYIDLLKAMLWL